MRQIICALICCFAMGVALAQPPKPPSAMTLQELGQAIEETKAAWYAAHEHSMQRLRDWIYYKHGGKFEGWDPTRDPRVEAELERLSEEADHAASVLYDRRDELEKELSRRLKEAGRKAAQGGPKAPPQKPPSPPQNPNAPGTKTLPDMRGTKTMPDLGDTLPGSNDPWPSPWKKPC